MKLRLTFTEPFKWSVEAFILKEELMKFRSLDELSRYIVETYIYEKWEKYFDKVAEKAEMPLEKREKAKEKYKSKMTEYVKKWIVEGVLVRR